jgi:hypothetical protein
MPPIHSVMNKFIERLPAFTANQILLTGAVVVFLIIFVSALNAPKESESTVSSSTETPSPYVGSSYGDFPSASIYNEASLMGFSDYETWKKFKASGFESKEAYDQALTHGVTSKKVWDKSAKSAIKRGMTTDQFLSHLYWKEASKQVLNYKEYMRHPDKYGFVNLRKKGKIIQVFDGGFMMLTAYNSYWDRYDDDLVLVTTPLSVNVFSPVVDDIVTVYGLGDGIYEYESAGAGIMRVPQIKGNTVDRHN